MKSYLPFLFVLILFVGCTKDAEKKVNVSNNNFDVELLFEHDGCKMYRFYDGKHIYYSDCTGKTSYNTGGKNNVYVETETYGSVD
ncbi:MAG: DUF4884 domain-containing protein [Richelia sp. RM2_1_2]|nr:DUF4884 domain-containing protein [Richelia sp. RM2_1_2]